jgi:hypothetical protein
MEITKTINEVKTDELKISNEMTIDFEKKKVFIGAKFDNEDFSCNATFEEIKAGLTGTQIDAINVFFNKCRRIALNSKINPDINLTDMDFENEF